MADQLNFTINRAVDANGDPAPGAKAYFYQSGTSTLRTVYTTDDASVAHPSPLVADSEGVFPAVFANGACKVLITDASDVTLTGYPMDPVFLVPTASTGANRITFAPTVEIPATNVQAAIEQVQENLAAPLADLGLGVTGSTTLLANLDATNTASGFYRFDGTTAGTFPAAVTASDGGMVLLWRETSAEGVAVIIPRGNNVTHYTRTLTASAWGAWVSNVIDEDDMASDSATRPPSQQSAKAYVDAEIASAISGIPAGAIELITSVTLAGDASADFSLTGYASYIVMLANVTPGTDNVDLNMRFSSDGGSTFLSSGYNYSQMSVQNTTTGTASGTSASEAALTGFGAGSAAGEDGVSGTVHIHNPALVKRTMFTTNIIYNDASGNAISIFGGGERSSQTAINAVRFYFASGVLESGVINLYGVSGT